MSTDETTPLEVATTGPLKTYQSINPKTGKVENRFMYLPGHPKQYRFDAKKGVFNINGTTELPGSTFTFQPIAWRIFTDNILNMGSKQWAEIFFIDDKGCVSTILFHGYSVDNIFRLIEPLYYDKLTLADAIITVTALKKENTKIQPKGIYFIADFAYKLAPAVLPEVTEFVSDINIYRADTLTDTAHTHSSHECYIAPQRDQPQGLPTAEDEEYLVTAGEVDDDVPY